MGAVVPKLLEKSEILGCRCRSKTFIRYAICICTKTHSLLLQNVLIIFP